jgi:alkylation response protein AidB-like acyl-CoA dehydrogenase
MDFNDSPEEAAFRAKARAWLEANAPPRRPPRGMHCRDIELMPEAKAWQAKKAAAGYAQIAWPRGWGGGDGTPIQQVIFNQEEAKLGISYGYFNIGLGMAIPTVISFADEETRRRFVGPAVRGEEVWCQLFSEPAGGVGRGGSSYTCGALR